MLYSEALAPQVLFTFGKPPVMSPFSSGSQLDGSSLGSAVGLGHLPAALQMGATASGTSCSPFLASPLFCGVRY